MIQGRECGKSLLVFALLVAVAVLLLQRQPAPLTPLPAKEDCNCRQAERELNVASSSTPNRQPSWKHRLLSYQPPGNGWNNQRIALENALVLSKLLNRTLLVHPLAPHELGNQMKAGLAHGYLAYNKMQTTDLLPLSKFLDLELMSQVVAVQEITVSHPEFVSDYSHLTWKNICHSPGYGFWVDQLPQSAAEVDLLSRQRFSSLGRVWKDKCPEQKARAGKMPGSLPFIRYVSDLQNDRSEMLYFEHGTLFGIHIRFTSADRALEAQQWVVNHIHYNAAVWRLVDQIQELIGPTYNAIQVRRKHHMDSKLPPSHWLERMLIKNFSQKVPVYVATNDASPQWFAPFVEEGFQLYFPNNLTNQLDFPDIKASLRNDYLAIHEQCLCMRAASFVGSPASTFNALILRGRGEVTRKGNLITDTLHTFWIGHQLKI